MTPSLFYKQGKLRSLEAYTAEEFQKWLIANDYDDFLETFKLCNSAQMARFTLEELEAKIGVGAGKFAGAVETRRREENA